MIFLPTAVAGAWEIDLEPHYDHRGSFARAFCQREFESQGVRFAPVQANLATTRHAGIVRGLHYQEPPHEDQKLVRCVSGAVLDVIVDMRPSSSTFRMVHQVRLDATQRRALFIPGSVAHGYQALEDNTEFLYMTDQFYLPGIERGIRHDDPWLDIKWPLGARDVADRDRGWPLLEPVPRRN